MKFTRRAVLKLLGGTAISLLPLPGRSGAQALAQPFFLIFDDILQDTSTAALETLLAPFAALEIPMGFLPGPQAAQGALPGYLQGFLRDHPKLAEAIAWAPDIVSAQPFFQLRMARNARARLEAQLGMLSGEASGFLPPATLATTECDGEIAMEAVRSAGFRNLMLLSESSGPTRSKTCLTTMPCMRGNLRHGITDEAYSIISAVRSAIGIGDMLVLVLSLRDIDAIPLDELRIKASVLADLIAADMQRGSIFAALPREHIFWFSTNRERLIGLRIVAPPASDAAANQAFAALQSTLEAAAIPFSLSGSTDAVGTDTGTPCPRLSWPMEPGAVICGFADLLPPQGLAALAEGGLEIVVQPTGRETVGMDDSGLLHLPEGLSLSTEADADHALDNLAPYSDTVISVQPAIYATEGSRAALLRLLDDATDTAGARIVAIADYASAILPDDPIYRIMQATRRDLAAPPPVPAPLTEAARDALMEDARIAWGYVDQLTDKTTGLCPSTAQFGEWPSVLRSLTMWDFASLIQATMAAHELGLISDLQYVLRAEALANGLPSERIAGLLLPSSEIATDRFRNLTLDYNACDTGRLLSALADLDRHPLSKDVCAAKVKAWDLEATLHDEQLNSVVRGVLAPLVTSHCTHYTSRSFGLWGISASSPYTPTPQLSVAETRMELLYRVAKIGPIGAEPLLLEGLEFGFSAPADYLADVLLTAQARSFAANGKLACVSEGPMDRAPWFTYQGLRVGADTDLWAVKSIDPAAQFQTPEFAASARAFSCKAAFLWAALRPGAYSERLLTHARAKGRASVIGYSSGIYTASGAAMKDYSDINTNGVILQAIAYMMRGSAPRFPKPL